MEAFDTETLERIPDDVRSERIAAGDLWRRWKAGQSLHEIGRAFGKSHSSIRCVVSFHGGLVRAVRRRSAPGTHTA
jgi:hypothetical protein